MFKRVLAVGLTALFLAGCGGGGSAVVPSHGSITPTTPTAPAATERVPFSIRIGGPATPTASHQRAPRYIPTSTLTMGVKVGTDVASGGSFVNTFPSAETYYDVSPSPSNPNCTPNGDGSRTCKIYLNVQPGTHIAIQVDLFKEPYAANFSATNPLASAVAEEQVVTGGGVNAISVTLNGVPASVVLGSLASVRADGNGPTSQTLHPVVKDAGGQTILGSYASAVVVSLVEHNGSGHTTLKLGAGAAAASVTLTSDADNAIAVAYDGWNGGANANLASPYYASLATSGATNNGSAELDPLFVSPATTAAAPLSLAVGTAQNAQTFTAAEHGFAGTFVASAAACPAGQFGFGGTAPAFTVTAQAAGPACGVTFGDGTVSVAEYVLSTSTSTTIVIPSTLSVAPSTIAVSKNGAKDANSVTIPSSASAAISGGNAPYTVDPSPCAAVAAVALSGTQLTASSPAGTAGNCTVVVKDAAGNQFNVKVTDSEPSAPPLVVTPSQIYVSINGFMGVGYQSDAYISGGTPPYAWNPTSCSSSMALYFRNGNNLHAGIYSVVPGQYCTGTVTDSAGGSVPFTATERDY